MQETIMIFSDKNIKKFLAANVPPLLWLLHFLIVVPTEVKFFQLQSLHIVDHAPYKRTDKLVTCHYILNGNLSCNLSGDLCLVRKGSKLSFSQTFKQT